MGKYVPVRGLEDHAYNDEYEDVTDSDFNKQSLIYRLLDLSLKEQVNT